MTKTRQDNDVTDHKDAVYIFMILNYRDWSDWVPYVMKTRQDNYVTDLIDVATPKTKLSCHYRSD